jgi:hypothetical protein
MVYQPLGSAGLGYGSDDEDNERKCSLRTDLITMIRIPVTLLAFADIVTWMCLGLPNSFVVIVFFLLFLVVGWNSTLVLPRSRFTRALPTVFCQVGNWVCGFNEDDDPDGRPRKPNSKKQKRRRLILIALVDLALGLIVTILMGEFTKKKEAETDVCLG